MLDEKGPFTVLEYKRDLSVMPDNAMEEYFAAEMSVRRRQLVCDVGMCPITTQAGAMQWMVGEIQQTTGIRGVGDYLRKTVRAGVTKESIVKPEYQGKGFLVLEPTYKHIILVDMDDWNGAMQVEDGMFYACDSRIQQQAVARTSVSSAIAGGEGLFNLQLSGRGIVALESWVPKEELVSIELDNDTLKIDGPMAIAWSSSLQFTVERSGKTLIGSAMSGEGLVNVYRGTGRVLMAPVRHKH